MKKIIEKAVETHSLSRDELIALLTDKDYTDELLQAADAVRKKYVGDEIHLRGLIEFSNYCKNNCLYCGLRRDNKELERYRIDIPTILTLAEHAKNMGLKTVVLQSGEDMHFTTERMVEIIKGIKALGLALTLSIGEKSLEEYAAYRQAGADRFLIRIETTDKKLYEDNDPGMSWEARAQCMRDLKKLGFELGSGCLVGLPNQTTESLADDILFFKEMSCDMIGIGPFIPHPKTPLKDAKGGMLDLSLKVMALTRLILPEINIPATTAMETLAPNGQARALCGGANVIMPNITMTDYRKHYQLYPGKTTTGYTPDESLERVIKKIESLGRTVGKDCGQSKKWLREQQSK